MTTLSNGAAESGTTGLEQLSDSALQSYAEIVAALGKRDIDRVEHGFDVKAMYHVVRLIGECEQILVEHDLDLERNREQLKSIRRGEWTLKQIETYFTEKERALEMLYATSTLPHSPDEAFLKQLLLDCLELHYGNLSTALVRNPSLTALLADLQTVLARYAD